MPIHATDPEKSTGDDVSSLGDYQDSYSYYCKDGTYSEYKYAGLKSTAELSSYCESVSAYLFENGIDALADDKNDSDLTTERILNYDSVIKVLPDSSMRVVESIKVVANNTTINHGIYRDFPTTYQDKKGNRYVVGFTVVSVVRDGVSEPFRVENLSNGKRVRIGDADIILTPGVYEYKITYTTNRQLGYFSDHDELYWNVTGNGWGYPIEKISAEVFLPENIPSGGITTYGYTGPKGSKEGAYVADVKKDHIEFVATQSLAPEEGLTIVVGWPKGFVREPTGQERWNYFLSDNSGIFYAFGLIVILFLYYFIVWIKYGRDPLSGTVVPQYEAPRGLSPAEVGYQTEMGYGKKVLTAAILDMAVKGYLTISESEGIFGFGKSYTLTKTRKEVVLREEELVVAESIFKTSDEIKLLQSNHEKLSAAEDGLKEILKTKFTGSFALNSGKIFMGIVVSLVVIVVGYLKIENISEQTPIILFLIVWLTGWSFGVFGIIKKISSLRAGSRYVLLITLLFGLPFIVAEVGVLVAVFFLTSQIFAIFAGLVIMINVIFVSILKRRTLDGRHLQDEIEGFKWFLSVTEKDRMNFHNPPEKTPALFEKFLPYALVLGVEQRWAEQFANVFASISQAGGTTYSPSWYAGTHFSVASVSAFTSDFGKSFSSAISSSSTAPGSSSGGGGGGSSGGGGGGGGGGGW
ncbi:MAG: DUF2207 domain-containing protein [Candidatus Paceibacterota bacterium]